MKIKIVVMSLIMMLPLISCVGSGDNSSNSGDGKLTPDALNDNLKVEITPKRVTWEKVFGYDVADLTKIGDSVDFTIKVTNTNTRDNQMVDPQNPDNLQINEKFWYFDKTKTDYAISMPIKDFKMLM